MEIKGHTEIRTFNVADISPATYNPRQIDDAALAGLAKSLEKFGLVEPIIVNVRDGKNVIVGGHQRFKVIQNAGVEKIACVVVDLSVEDEKLLNLALNNPHIQGTFIDSISDYIATLKDQIPNEQDILDLRLDELMGQIEAKEGLTDDDAVPEPPKEAVTKPGDIWLMGCYTTCPHCGGKNDVE
jgi:ParB-like chromosome segregation protein Spo0J